jgi:hypothetical protein
MAAKSDLSKFGVAGELLHSDFQRDFGSEERNNVDGECSGRTFYTGARYSDKANYFRFCLTSLANFDSLEKFAPKCSATSSRAAARLRFPDPSGPLRRFPAWIFDNQVEHASRENREDLGLIILTMLVLRSLFERCEGDCSGDLRRPVAIIRFQTRV